MYPPKVDFVHDILTFQRAQALFFESLKRNIVGSSVNFPVDLVAPRQGLSIEIRQAVVLDSNHEVVPHKLNRPLLLAFRLSPVGAAQDGFKAVESRKVFKLPVQGAVFLFEKSFHYHLLHVVIQDLFRIPAKIPECVLVAPDERIGTHVCDKLYVPHPRVAQYQ